MQNLQIGARAPPPAARPGPAPPFGAPPGSAAAPISRPGPPPPGARPQAATGQRPAGPPPAFASSRPFASNGPLAPSQAGAIGQQIPPPGSALQAPQGAPPPGVRPFVGSGSPPSVGAPTGQLGAQQPPFSGAPPSQGLPGSAQAPQSFSGSLPSRPPFSSASSMVQSPFAGGLSTSQPPFSAVPQQAPFSGAPLASQPPFIGSQLASQPPIPSAAPAFQTPFSGAPAAFGAPFSGPPSATQPPFSGIPPTARPFPGPPGPQLSGSPSAMPPFPGTAMTPPVFSAPPGAAGPYGSPTWSSQVPQGGPLMPGTMQPPRMYGVPAHATAPGHSPYSTQMSTPSKIDPTQIPRPAPSSSLAVFETRQGGPGGQANIPPPATSDFIVRDTGNCSPRYMRCTIHQIPCTGDLLTTSSMPLALLVQPFALPNPSEEPIQVVDFGERGPLRCSRCKGYINPFMKFIDQGRRFICNLCGFTDDTPREYHCNLGPDGRRRDADERPELCRGTVEFVATKEYMVREPMPAAFFFLVDVSMNAVQTGATAAACSAITQAIADLPEGPRTMVGIATFDSTIHFYNLKRALQQPLMLIVPDVEDVYTPLHSDLIVQLTECRQHLEQLLETIPAMFANNKVSESSFGAAMKAAFLALKPTGGKLLVFQSVLPSVGIGSLSGREAEGRTNIAAGDKEAHKLLQPADKILKTMAIEFAEYQVCVDVFLTTQTYVDIASIGVVPRTTGGQVYYYYPFSALSDAAKLYNDLRWNISRPQGFEAVMRVRCSQGIQVQDYFGNFCKRIPTDIDLPGIDCDKTIMVTFKHDDKFQEGSECAFQSALLYTTVYGQRRIRVSTLSLPCTSMLTNLFRSADLDTQFASFLKQGANGIPTSPLSQVREQMTNLCINILHSYRKYCATVSSSGQLILPEALKLLPLYTLALIKSVGLRTDGRLDDRSYWVSRVVSLSTVLSVPLVYPRMIALHDVTSKSDDGSIIPTTMPLSSEHISDDGIYLLENGEDGLIYVGGSVNPDTLQQIFGSSSMEELPTQLVLQQHDNALSKKVNDVINEIRRQRCSYLRLRLCRKGDPSGMLFFSYMIEDKTPGGLSYVEFLVHVHRQIQTKMA